MTPIENYAPEWKTFHSKIMNYLLKIFSWQASLFREIWNICPFEEPTKVQQHVSEGWIDFDPGWGCRANISSTPSSPPLPSDSFFRKNNRLPDLCIYKKNPFPFSLVLISRLINQEGWWFDVPTAWGRSFHSSRCLTTRKLYCLFFWTNQTLSWFSRVDDEVFQ